MAPADSDAKRRQAAARLLYDSRRSGGNFAGFSADLRPQDETDAYLIQKELHQLLESSDAGRQIGWKIGCTTPVMQELLGIDHPCAGGMFAASSWNDHHGFNFAFPRRLGVECEIAVRIGIDLSPRARPYENAEVAAAIEASMAAIEVVEDRYLDYRSLDSLSLIADDFFHYGCVLGALRNDIDPNRLRDAHAEMKINGEVTGRGSGSDVMGEPLSVLSWLANMLSARDTCLLAGDTVLLGSLVEVQWVNHGDVVEISNDLLGTVNVEIGPG